MGSLGTHPNQQALAQYCPTNLLTSKLAQYSPIKAQLLLSAQILLTFFQLRSSYPLIVQALKLRPRYTVVPFTELSSYLAAQLGLGLIYDHNSVKAKKVQLYQFAKLNLLGHADFVFCRVLKVLDLTASNLLAVATLGKLQAIQVLIKTGVTVINSLLRWLYGAEAFQSLVNRNADEETNDSIIRLYRNQLCEYLVFGGDKQQSNMMLKLRKKETHLIAIKVRQKLPGNKESMKKTFSRKSQLMREEILSLDVVVHLIERMARTPLFTSKYKLLCIIFDTIPHIYLQEERKKYNRSFNKTFSHTPDKSRSLTPDTTFKRSSEVETILSSMLSSERKRDLSRLMLNEWALFTKRDIILDVMLPLELLQQDGYVQQPEYCLWDFLHGLYELLEIEEPLCHETK